MEVTNFHSAICPLVPQFFRHLTKLSQAVIDTGFSNRRFQVNCETANINKTVSAAVKQIEDIEFIRDTVGFESLPDGLAQIARARLLKPEATLKELGEDLEPPVGKSGVNHRLRKLGEMAEKLREQGTET